MPLDTKANRKKVVALGCVVCSHCLGIEGTPASIHHVKKYPGQPRPKRDIIPICPHHHQYGGYGQAVHDGRETWEENFETELFFVQLTDELIGE